MKTHVRRFGIEEEFFICDYRKYSLLKRRPDDFFNACIANLGDRVSQEVLECQIELKTPIMDSEEQASDLVLSGRGKLVSIAQSHGLALFAAGTHPLGQWRSQSFSSGERYDALQRDFRIIAHRNLLCGLHVHVEVPEATDRIWLMNQIMDSLPLFLALSGSSPYWAGQDTGLSSYRQSAYDEWPRTGIPRLFNDEREYHRYTDLLRRTRAISDESHIWWAIRPSSRYPTLELRITDSCPLAIDTLCLAEIFRTLVHHFVLEWPQRSSSPPDPIARLIIEENRWRAKRFGTSAQFIHLESDAERTVQESLEAMRERCSSTVKALNATRAFDRAGAIARFGNSAARQRMIYAAVSRNSPKPSRAGLSEVVSSLINETAV